MQLIQAVLQLSPDMDTEMKSKTFQDADTPHTSSVAQALLIH